ncbi:MAG: hypothetical protein ICV85_17800 [Tolypothrix sp. T3-bin4]|nr:hypothetical protein [Tolypothrix sp. T3-bin4]
MTILRVLTPDPDVAQILCSLDCLLLQKAVMKQDLAMFVDYHFQKMTSVTSFTTDGKLTEIQEDAQRLAGKFPVSPHLSVFLILSYVHT